MIELFRSFAFKYLQARPKVNVSKCVGCGACKEVCPSHVIDLFPLIPDVEVPPKTGEPRFRPEINYLGCNRCYLCMENCPRAGIEEYKPGIGKIL